MSTQPTQPEALRLANVCSNLTKYSMDAHLIAAELRRLHAYAQELESQVIVDCMMQGTPTAMAPWRSAVLDLIDDCPGLTLEQDRWLSRRVKELDFPPTPNPAPAQAVVMDTTSAKTYPEIAVESCAKWPRCGCPHELECVDAHQRGPI